ncbi:MAG: hypothetical protein WDW36_007422 [Sanguina aurantia]
MNDCAQAADAEEPTESSSQQESSSDNAADIRVKKTISGLDSLLGIVDEPPEKLNAWRAKSTTEIKAAAPSSAADQSASSISKEALDKLSQADASRPAGSKPAGKDPIEEQFMRIIDKAKKLADEQNTSGGRANVEAEQANLRAEFETLLTAVSKGPSVLTKDELAILKTTAFGPMRFWVTETLPFQDADRSGVLIRGNLRDDREKVFKIVCERVKEMFGDKYTVLLVEDTTEGGPDSEATAPGMPGASTRPGGVGGASGVVNRGPRVAFQIVPTEQTTPPPTNGWKSAASFLLSGLFVAACVQLSLVANTAKLPKETLAFFANPDNLNSDLVPPGLDTWDPTSYIATAAPILGGLVALNVAHELAHRVAAAQNDVKLGPSYFVPNLQIGSFSAITPFASLLKDRRQLWDVAAAGPAAGVAVSVLLLAVGLSQSAPGGGLTPDQLVPVPSTLFQGSLLLGGLARLVLGEAAMRSQDVMISPLVVAGWCGLVSNALNLLPVGQLDGGRLVQAAYGRGALSLSSFFTYVGLGLGLLGSSLALPFGLYIIICQREAERYIQDTVTPPSSERQTVTAIAVLAAVFVLLPMAPEIADSFGVGPANPFL